MAYTVIVGEAQTLFREMITSFVEEMEEFEVIAKFGDGQQVLDFIEQEQSEPSLVLLSSQLPNLQGWECVKRIKQVYPDAKAVILSTHDDDSTFEAALMVGADGYILKDTSLDRFKEALRFVIAGDFIAPQTFIRYFSSRLSVLRQMEREQSFAYIEDRLPIQSDMTQREKNIIQLIQKGWINKKIAEKLKVSEGTVKKSLSQIYQKLGIKSRVELIELLTD
ncbi:MULTISPECIES: response regulator [Gracilibacillus]|uniref:response regulator n=1 Tax=Gracilibacillus TaxID=74385 RepID=UPI000826D2D9|nr:MULTISPECIES: response regulator transcription factor [Gracilibacillus]